MEFWRYYRVLRQRRGIIIAAVLAALAAGLVMGRPGFGDFSATATVAIPSAQRFFFASGAQGGVPAQASPEILTQLAIDEVRSPEVAARALQQFHVPGVRPADLEDLIAVRKDPASDRIRITAQGRTAGEAVGLANAVADATAAYDQEIQRRETALAREFMERQAAGAAAKLRAAEDALLQFQRQNGAVMASAQAQQVGSLQAQLQQVDLSLDEANARLGSVDAQMNGQSSTRTDQQISDNPIAQQLRSRLVQLEVALTSELAVHTESHPNVIALRAMIQAVRDRLSTELTKIVSTESVVHNPVYDALTQARINAETDKLALLAKREALQRALAGAAQLLPGLAEKQMDQARLARTIEILGRQVTDLQGQLAQVRLRELEAQNLRALTVTDHARTAKASPFQGRRFTLTLAGVLGLLGGVALVFSAEYLDNTIKTPEFAERLLGVPALATIPRHNPPFDEAYRMLRVNLAARESPAASVGEAADVIAVTGPKPGTGTSTVVTNLARAFAQAGRRTILVDAALRRPSLHARLGVPNDRGLAEVLAGRAAVEDVLVGAGPNLWLLPSGANRSVEARALLGSPVMEAVLADLRRRGDLVLVDTCPAGAFADVFALARLATGVLLAIDAGQAPRGVEEQVKLALERVGANVIGLVLTKVRPDLVDSYYYQERYYREAPRRRLSPAAATAGLAVLVIAAGLLTGMTISTRVQRAAMPPSAVEHAVARWVAMGPR